MSTRVGTPVAGELLAGRYRLVECLAEYPRTQRTLWRGTDEVLNRPVAVELRVPGGAGSEEFLDTAMTVARLVHPAVIGVYDAVDEGDRAYVVREWVRGSSLGSVVRDAPLAPDRAAAVARAVAEGLAALHAAGASHGNVNPNSVLVEPDDTVTLTDLRPAEGSAVTDVRAVGAILYATLTGRWPAEVPAPAPGLPDAVRADGRLCSPRQVRAGIPAYLDSLTMDLLDPALPTATAADLAADLRRFDVEDHTMAFYAAEEDDTPHRSRWMRAVLPLVSVLVVGLLGWLIGLIVLPPGSVGSFPSSDDPTKSHSGPLQAFHATGAEILDPGGDGTELDGADLTVDGDVATAWKTDVYTRPNFGNLPGKVGMGVRVDLGEAKSVREVTVHLNAAGAALELRRGDTDTPDPAAYEPVAEEQNAGQTVKFTVPAGANDRYWVVWITSLPPKNGGYGVEVQEISLSG